MRFVAILLNFILIFNVAVAAETGSEEDTFGGADSRILDEAEQDTADNHISESLNQDVMEEHCDPTESDLCYQSESGFKDGAMRTIEQMAPMVIQMYSQIVSMGGGTIAMKDKNADAAALNDKKDGNTYKPKENGKGATKTNSKGKETDVTEDKPDYCSYMAMAIEMGAQAYVTINNQKQIEENEETADMANSQAKALYDVAIAHENQAKAHQVQFYGWAGVSACYAVYMVAGASMNAGGGKSAMLVAKMAGAVLITTFWGLKIDAHKKRADEIRAIADKLPGRGDCNPVTDTSCFCAHPRSAGNYPAEFEKACVVKQYKGRGDEDFAASCVNAKNQADHECKCKLTNTCIDKLAGGWANNLEFGKSLMAPFQPLKSLAKGSFDTGKMDSNAKANLAFAKKALKKYGNKAKDTPKLNLNKKQKKMAEGLYKNGIPKAAAAVASTKRVKNSPFGNGLSGGTGLRGLNRKHKAALKKVKAAGYGKAKGKSSRRRRSKSSDPYGRFRKKKSGNRGGIEEMNFGSLAEKAEYEAQISNDSSRPIFESISYRYKASWKNFEDTIWRETEYNEEDYQE